MSEAFWLQRGHAYFVDSDWFFSELKERLKADKNVLALVTGHTGRGKTCWAIKIAQAMDPNFNASQIVFNYKQFRTAIETSNDNAWIVWDEPNKGLSHRDWYLDVNKAISTYLQTFRFRHKNVLFALPKSSLIDKSARVVCLFEAIMQKEGLAKVYQYEHNHFGTPEIYKWKRGEVQTLMPDHAIMKEYYALREQFHEQEFPEEKIVEEEEKAKGWRRIYELVKANPEMYRVKDSRNPEKAGRLSARTISALLDCSDNTARKVVTKIEFENSAQPILPS